MLLAGPFTGRLLGDMGAEIIKVEPPGQPDPLRDWGHARYEGRSLWWPVQSRNKKCVTLNLREERGQELLLALVEHSDVLVENFRPGTLERWNLAPERLWEVEPGARDRARLRVRADRAVRAARRASRRSSEAMGGIRYINGFPDEPPPRIHISLGDSLAGMFAAQGILAALYRRDALGGGRGQVVDVSLMEACFALLESMVPEYDRLGHRPRPWRHRAEGRRPLEHLQVERREVDGDRRERGQGLRPAVRGDGAGRSSREDARFATHVARGEHQEELEGIVAEWAARHAAAEIDAVLNEAGVICGPIYTIADIFEDEQFQRPRDARRAPRPGVRRVHRPRHRPQVLRDAGRGALVGDVGGGEPQRGRLRRPARALRRRARRAEGGRIL